MFTPHERRALLFLTATAALGALVRAVRADPDAAPGSALIAPDLAAGDLAAQEAKTKRARALARPLEPGSRVDLDHAAADEIERLPRIGPALARRIVDERTAHGPFGSLAGLSRVPGMGPATLAGLEKSASFSGVPAVMAAPPPDASGWMDVQDPQALPGRPTRNAKPPRPTARAAPPPVQGMGPAISTMPLPPPPQRLGAFTLVVPRERRSRGVRALPAVHLACPSLPLDINAASASELTCLPGVGPSLAQQIVTWRTAHGRFAQVTDLEQVPGIGPGRFQRVQPYIRAP